MLRIDISERIPAHVDGICHMDCSYVVRSFPDYFLLTLNVVGELTITCQRCGEQFLNHYSNQTVLALCHSDERAEKLMPDYDCVVVKDNQVDLIQLVTDELHLYSPEKHVNYCLDYR